jgi:hypothetical protein
VYTYKSPLVLQMARNQIAIQCEVWKSLDPKLQVLTSQLSARSKVHFKFII